uniref:Chromobox 7 n=1 Tax=Aceria tosichella TaxID=561515 RepID=A0A6G1SL61_9ACAR
MSQGQDIYICEKILKKRISKGIPLYLIKWKDYPMKASTWEPKENILDPQLLTSFEKELKRKKLNKKKLKRPNQTRASPEENGDGDQSNNNTLNNKTAAGKPQMIVFNPQSCKVDQPIEIVYEPELTRDPILVTDVTSEDFTVTISECRAPDGFFKT